MGIGKFFKKVGKGIGQAVSGISRGVGQTIKTIEKGANLVKNIPIIGGAIESVYKETPIKAIVDVARKPIKDIAKIGEAVGGGIQKLAGGDRSGEKQLVGDVKNVIRSGRELQALGKNVYQNRNVIRNDISRIKPMLSERFKNL